MKTHPVAIDPHNAVALRAIAETGRRLNEVRAIFGCSENDAREILASLWPMAEPSPTVNSEELWSIFRYFMLQGHDADGCLLLTAAEVHRGDRHFSATGLRFPIRLGEENFI